MPDHLEQHADPFAVVMGSRRGLSWHMRSPGETFQERLTRLYPSLGAEQSLILDREQAILAARGVVQKCKLVCSAGIFEVSPGGNSSEVSTSLYYNLSQDLWLVALRLDLGDMAPSQTHVASDQDLDLALEKLDNLIRMHRPLRNEDSERELGTLGIDEETISRALDKVEAS